MNKKGQGMSLNVIIIAALALIVLVVLIAIFTGRIGVFSGEVASAEATAKAKAANIAKTTCEGTCFAQPKWVKGAYTNDLVGVTGSVKSSCANTEVDVKGTFTDVGKDQKCCVLAQQETGPCTP